MCKYSSPSIFFSFSQLFLLPILLLTFLLEPSTGSLINKITIQNLNLKDSNSIIDSPWTQYGFRQANTTTPPHGGDSFGSRNASSIFLVARGPSYLRTRLHSYNHTYLCVSFFSLIGKSFESAITSPTTPTTTTTTTTTIKPDQTIIKIIPDNISPTGGVSINNPNSSSSQLVTLSTNVSPNQDHVIEITLNNPNELVSQYSPAISNNGNSSSSSSNTSMRRRRRRRELDSREISQVHEIISKISNLTPSKQLPLPPISVAEPENVASNPSPVELETNPTKSPEIQLNDPIVALNSELILPQILNTEKPVVTPNPRNMNYRSWKDGGADVQTKPPGFYLMIDDKIVYDNWEGVWKSSNVMGRTLFNSSLKLWNETEIWIEMDDYDPHRDVKIDFEWEPMDASSFLFLNDITLSTLEGASPISKSENMQQTPPAAPPPTLVPVQLNQQQPQQAVLHNNITLTIVVKAENKASSNNNGTEQQQATNDGKMVTTQNSTSVIDNNTKATTLKAESTESTPTTIGTIMPTQKPVKILNRDPNIDSSNWKNKSNITAMVVLGIILCLVITIIIGLVHRKYKEKRHLRPAC